MRERADNVTVVQDWPLTSNDTKGRSLVISLGGDGTYLRTTSMMPDNSVPMLGINTDPGRSLGILTSKFLYKERTKPKNIHKIVDQLEEGEFRWAERQRAMCKITAMGKYDESQRDEYDEQEARYGSKIFCDQDGNLIINKLMLNEVFLAEKDASKTSIYQLI